jgi:AAA family ATP:ADP antiporter
MTIVKKKFSSEYISNKKIFIFCILACGFLIATEYAITRPPSNGVFLSLFTAKYLPLVWAITLPFNFLVIYLYNRFLPVLGCFKTLLYVGISIIFINTLSAFYITDYPLLSFLQFIWKDIYILLMFKQMWSLIHSTIDAKKAKYLYGVFFSVGGIGGIIGGCIPSFFAVHVGSQRLFFLTMPFYLILFVFYYFAVKKSNIQENQTDVKKSFASQLTAPKGGFSLIYKSKFLLFVLMMVVCMQLSISLLDYQFNCFLEKNISSLDLRTQYMGRLFTLTNIITTFLQLFGGYLFLHFFGLKKSHLIIPIFLCTNAVLFLLFPSFLVVSYSFIAIKTLDYSIFSIGREMLYIPMSLDEKFRAKAIIDVLAYRSAKACGSLLLLILQIFNMFYLIGTLSIIIFIFWMLLIVMMFKHFNYKKEHFQKFSFEKK